MSSKPSDLISCLSYPYLLSYSFTFLFPPHPLLQSIKHSPTSCFCTSSFLYFSSFIYLNIQVAAQIISLQETWSQSLPCVCSTEVLGLIFTIDLVNISKWSLFLFLFLLKVLDIQQEESIVCILFFFPCWISNTQFSVWSRINAK